MDKRAILIHTLLLVFMTQMTSMSFDYYNSWLKITEKKTKSVDKRVDGSEQVSLDKNLIVLPPNSNYLKYTLVVDSKKQNFKNSIFLGEEFWYYIFNLYEY